MHEEMKRSFAFLVLTYNHQDYILEHLESIKYLVQTYGNGIDVDIVVNDDASKDHTRRLVDKWFQSNGNLFRHVKTIYNPANLGTCASVNNMLDHVFADRCKITAGDDVYSFENIFELTLFKPEISILSGRALYLWDGALGVDLRSKMLATATQVIYEKNCLLHRFKHLSYSNAPNIIYAIECLMNPNTRAYLQHFDVTEDWPLQIAIARQYPERKMALIDEVLVYYRRTAGSTYIVANKRFVKDKVKIYDDLIKNEPKWFERQRLSIRKFCFNIQRRRLSKILNLDLYFFALSVAVNLLKILNKNKALDLRLIQHQEHYARIHSAAQAMGLHLSISEA